MQRWMQSGAIVALAGLFFAGLTMGDDTKAKEGTQGKEVKAKEECSHGQEAKVSRLDYKPELRRISEIKGLKVLTEKGDTLGTIENTIIDIDHGRVAYAVVSHGGLLGIGAKNVLLPFVTISCKAEGAQVRTTATLDQFKQSEGFDENKADQVKKLSDPAFAERYHRQFGVRPYWEHAGGSSEMKYEKTGWREKGAAEAAVEEGRPGALLTESEMATTKPAGEVTHKHGPGEMVVATTLLSRGGVEIKTEAGVKVGHLSNFMVDLTRGHIAYAIVDRERELVSENRLCAVPWELIALRQAQPRPNLLVDLPVAKIKDAPGFATGKWPDMAKTDWNEQINAYYDSTPYYVIYGYVTTAEEWGPSHTLEGTIVSINREARGPGLLRPGVQVTLKVEKDQTQAGKSMEGSTVMVNLAPTYFLDEKGITLTEGGKFTVTGFEAMYRPGEPAPAGQAVIVGREIRIGEKSLSLRNDRGEPMWTWQK